MAYEALARKWRPKTFDEIVGQGHVTRALANAITSGKIHHAYLFSGTRGVGKTTFARILARGKADGTLHLPSPVRETAEMLRGSFYGTTRLKMLDLIRTSFPRLARMMEAYWLKALAPQRDKKNPPGGS
jgi:replication-associated recombination protein RarA